VVSDQLGPDVVAPIGPRNRWLVQGENWPLITGH
jgi:hypothetical protein